jgi:hypothetical protein
MWEVSNMVMKKRLLSFGLSVALVSVAVIGLADAPRQQPDLQMGAAAQGRDRASGFGRPESITGVVSSVRPEEGLLVVTQRGPAQPASTVIAGTTVVTRNPDGAGTMADTEISARPGPGETDYRFRVTTATLIHVNGQSITFDDLVNLQNKQVTVHFVPQRNGNFAKEVDVSR